MKIAVAGATGTVGRHVVVVAHQRGHEVLALSRAAGVDLTSGLGLAEMLSGSQTMIDVTSGDVTSGQVTVGPFTIIPTMISQPVAAREVAERLIFHAESGPNGLDTDRAGPHVLRMADMVTRYAKAIGDTARILELPLPGGFGRALRNSTLVASPSADHGKQTFSEWADSVERLSWR